jgi:hypothetical protein
MPLLVALTLTGMWGLRLRDKVDDRDDQMAQLQAQISNLGTFVVGAESFQMEAGPGGTDAAGRIVVGDDKKAATLVVQMDEPTLSRAYDVYVNKGGTLVPAGEVRVDEQGFGVATIPLDEPFANYTSVEVEAKPLLTDGTDLHEPDTGDGILAWHQQAVQPSIGDTSVEPTP